MYVCIFVNSEGVVVARESAQYTKVQSLVHTLERDEKRFFCNSEFHGYRRNATEETLFIPLKCVCIFVFVFASTHGLQAQ